MPDAAGVEQAANAASSLALGSGGLTEAEVEWQTRQPWLKQHGYQLRPRFRPGWIPSWQGKKNMYWQQCEDGQRMIRSYLMDAVRISDGVPVLLKVITRGFNEEEIPIGRFFSSESLASDPRNHCVPLYDVLEPPEKDTNDVILVLPLLRQFDDPPFSTVGEAVDFFAQIIEGLVFMHEHNVAHRDCNSGNIMMDARELYPDGYHPVEPTKTPDFRGSARHITRTQRPPKYYLIDFGISRQYKPEERPPSEPVVRGGDKSPPEHKTPDIPCDPFPTDVYYIGNMIREEFLQKRRGFHFMEPLVREMVQDDPLKRPTMDQVALRFREIQGRLGQSILRMRVARRREFFPVALIRDVFHYGGQLGEVARRRPPLGQLAASPP